MVRLDNMIFSDAGEDIGIVGNKTLTQDYNGVIHVFSRGVSQKYVTLSLRVSKCAQYDVLAYLKSKVGQIIVYTDPYNVTHSVKYTDEVITVSESKNSVTLGLKLWFYKS